MPKKLSRGRNSCPLEKESEGTSFGFNSSSLFDGKYAWTDSRKGFLVKIYHQKTLLGIVEVEEISSQEYIEQYLNLALSIVEVCGLIIENARKHERMIEKEQRSGKKRKKLNKPWSR